MGIFKPRTIKPLAPPPPPPDVLRQVGIFVKAEDGTGIAGATVTLGGQVNFTNPDGFCAFQLRQTPDPVVLIVDAAGYDAYRQTLVLQKGNFNLTSTPNPAALDQAIPPLHRSRLFPPETAPLHVTANYFRRPDGSVFRWQGATMFMLLARQMRGEDTTPQWQWCLAHGVNTVRVFVAGVPWGGEWADFARPYERSDYTMQLAKLFDDSLAYGIRVEATVATDNANDVARWQPVLQRVYASADGRPNLCVEWVNEPWVNGSGLLAAPVDRRGVLSAYGSQPDDNNIQNIPALDYITTHLPRDMTHFPRNSKDILEMMNACHRPVVDDEPLGVADYEKTGSGARTTNEAAVVGHFAVAALWGGATFHSQAGLEGRAPSAAEPITERLAQRVARIWQFIPERAITGTYTRPYLGDYPLAWTAGDIDSQVGHAYASILGGVEGWVVVPMPRPGYTPSPINGWQIVEQCDDLPIWHVRR